MVHYETKAVFLSITIVYYSVTGGNDAFMSFQRVNKQSLNSNLDSYFS